MFGTGSGDTPGEYLSPLGNKTAERIGVLIVYFQLLDTEFADLLLEKNFAFTAAAIVSITSIHLGITTILPIAIGPGRAFTVINIFFVRHINLVFAPADSV